MSIFNDIATIGRLVRPHRVGYATGLASLLTVNLADVLAPLFMAVAVDISAATLAGADPPDAPALLRAVGLSSSELSVGIAIGVFLGLHVLANLMRYPMTVNVAGSSHMIGQTLRNRIVAHLMRLSRPYYDGARSGDLMSLGTNDISAIRMMLGPGILVGSDTFLLISFVIVVLLSMSPTLTAITVIPLPFIAWLTNRLSRREYERFEEVQKDVGELTERARESFAGIRVVQGYGVEAEDAARFEKRSLEHMAKQLRLARVRSVFQPTLDLMPGISTVLVLVFGGIQVARETLSMGSFVAFVFLVGFLSGPMMGFGWTVTLFQRGRASLSRVERFLAQPVTIVDGEDEIVPSSLAELTVKDLTFAYTPQAEPVLKGVNLTIPPGTTVGVIGPVGSGKSTLANLLVRLYEPPANTVMLDGSDIRSLTLANLRDNVVLAAQDNFLFSDSVARNILLAHQIDDNGDPRPYARLASIDEEISAMPAQYATLLGERGVTMSGGQRQRTSLARAIASPAPVLILDDCLSAVDARTEMAILTTMREVFDQRSGIIISHRVAAVRDCDQIIVLEGGVITERGTHEELSSAGGYYERTATAQSQAEEASE
jgi:ATP-binding cassette subfamily B protein